MMTITKVLGSYKGASQDQGVGSRLDLYDAQKRRSSPISKKDEEQFKKILMEKLKAAHK